MPSLQNHMEGGSRHETNEFSQNVSLTFLSNFYYDVKNITYESN